MPQAAHRSSIEKIADSLTWKVVSALVSVCLLLLTSFVSFYVFYYVPNLIDNRITTKLENLSKTPNAQVVGLTKDLDGLRGSIDYLRADISRLDKKMDDYLLGIARSRPKTHHALTNAVSARRSELTKTLPVARELLKRAKEQGTVLGYGEIKQVAKTTLPLLRREQKGSEVRQQILNTLAELAEYKTFVDGKRHTQPISNNFCSNGEASLGGIPLQDATFVNCTIRYRGGDIILKNVRYVDCKFVLVDEPDAERFLAALLLTNKPTVDLGSLHSPSGNSSSE